MCVGGGVHMCVNMCVTIEVMSRVFISVLPSVSHVSHPLAERAMQCYGSA